MIQELRKPPNFLVTQGVGRIWHVKNNKELFSNNKEFKFPVPPDNRERMRGLEAGSRNASHKKNGAGAAGIEPFPFKELQNNSFRR